MRSWTTRLGTPRAGHGPVVGPAFDRLIAAPLPEIFSRRFAAFPPVREVVDQPDDWGTVGQDRTILLADGMRPKRSSYRACT